MHIPGWTSNETSALIYKLYILNLPAWFEKNLPTERVFSKDTKTK